MFLVSWWFIRQSFRQQADKAGGLGSNQIRLLCDVFSMDWYQHNASHIRFAHGFYFITCGKRFLKMQFAYPNGKSHLKNLRIRSHQCNQICKTHKRKSGHAVFFYLQINDAETINLSNQLIESCELSCGDSAHSLQESFIKCHSVLDTSHHINCLTNTSNTHNTVFNFCRSV